MVYYLVRRLLIGALTLLMITCFVYALIRAMPGSPITNNMAELDPSKSINKEEYERMKRQFGLDKPWYIGYATWLGGVCKFDLQDSLTRRRNVGLLIRERLAATLLLSGTSLILAYLFSIPLGLFSSATSDSIGERSMSTFLYMLYSLPAFVAALYLQIIFHLKLGWLPLDQMTSPEYETFTFAGKVGDIMFHSLMPVFCFTYGSLAYFTRFVKANMQEEIQQDYIRTARAKGVSERVLLVKHAFRNTLIPLVTLIGLTLPTLLSGTIILEKIFTWPGMGSLFFESILQRDYPTIMGLVLMFSVLTLAGQLLADILYAIVDPRITYS